MPRPRTPKTDILEAMVRYAQLANIRLDPAILTRVVGCSPSYPYQPKFKHVMAGTRKHFVSLATVAPPCVPSPPPSPPPESSTQTLAAPQGDAQRQ